MELDKEEVIRLKKRYAQRTKGVFYCRVSFYFLFAFLVIFFPLSNWELYAFFTLSEWLFIFFILAVCAFFSERFSNHRLGRWFNYVSLIADVFTVGFLVVGSGGIFSPVLLLQPVFTIFFTLLFPNPFVSFPPLILLPVAVIFSNDYQISNKYFFEEIITLIFYGVVSGGLTYFTNYVVSKEESDTREIMRLQKALRNLLVAEERNRIAREIHDGVGAALSGVIMQAQYLALLSKNEPTLFKEVQELKLSSEEAIDELRRSLSVMKDDFDLVYQLHNFCRNFQNRHKLNVQLEIKGTAPFLSHDQQLTLFRVIQEALNNISKHAEATVVHVSVGFNDTGFSLSIKDNGKGFDVNKVYKNHYGLINMEDRAKKIGAEFSLTSSLGKGSEVKLIWKK